MAFYNMGWFFALLLLIYGMAVTGAAFRLASSLVLAERALQREREDIVGETYFPEETQ